MTSGAGARDRRGTESKPGYFGARWLLMWPSAVSGPASIRHRLRRLVLRRGLRADYHDGNAASKRRRLPAAGAPAVVYDDSRTRTARSPRITRRQLAGMRIESL